MSAPLRIGIAGLGTVGGGALRILQEHRELIEQRCGRMVQVVAVCARDRKKDRGLDVAGMRWFEDPLAMAGDAGIDVIVETIGGAEGPARQLVEKALQAGKSVVTANKALIAHHGVVLAKMAEKSGAVLAFEAAVAGGIPVIKALRDGLAGNRVSRVVGILNGTCNYILTKMLDEKRGFDDVLKEAQGLGYAEAEPSFDIDGIDTAHKLAILASLAYGCPPAPEKVYVEGIRRITLLDMQFAAELGFTVKLLGIAALENGKLFQRVHPAMVAKAGALAGVSGVTNAVLAEGDAVGTLLLEGRGAGAGPTGSSVVADIMDIARGVKYNPFTLPAAALKALPVGDMGARVSSYYLRIGVEDRPGVLAEVTGILKNEQISLRTFLQHSPKAGEAVQLVLTTHETNESAMLRAIGIIAKLGSVREQPHMVRIETL